MPSSSPRPTRRQTILGLAALPLLPALPSLAWAATPAIDPMVELLVMVFRLAGNPEHSDCRLPGYAESADTWFRPVRDHAVVKRARRLRKERGVSHDAVISLALHLDAGGGLRVPLDDGLPDLDARWPREEVAPFVEELQGFARDSKAAEFLASKEKTHARIEAGVTGLHASMEAGWHERFFGAASGARYRVIASPLAGPSSYGVTLKVAGGQEIVSVLGVWEFGHDGLPTFGSASLATLIHETSHSFVNPLVAAHEAAFAPALARLYPWVSARMASMAYTTWQIVLAESLVRASVVRYLAANDELAVEDEIEDQLKRGFAWIEPLADALARYEEDRARWPGLASFVPELVAFFDRYGREYDKRMTAQTANRPRVTSVSPADGAAGVDPATPAITVAFDRAMKDQSWAVVGSPAELPRMGTLKYDAAGTTLTIPVTLRPATTYTIRLNSERFTDFKSADGTPLAPFAWSFTTR